MTEEKKKSRNIVHVELTPLVRRRLDEIVRELSSDPRWGAKKVSRQVAFRHAVIAYGQKEERG